MKSVVIFLLLIAFLTTPSFAREMRGTIYNVSDGIVEWNSSDFPGFFHDIDKGVGAERLDLNIIGERVEPGAAQYISSIQDTAFEHKEWGSYRVLCFLGEEYFAGYSDDCKIAFPWNSLGDGNLSKVLIDVTERKTFASNEALPLANGYNLGLSDAEKGVKVSLYKDGLLKNTTVIQPPADYVYTARIGNHNTTLIAVNIKSNVRLMPYSYYTVAGIFQVSEKAMPIKVGTTYGMMTLKSNADSELLLINNVSLNLTRNKDIEIIDGIKIKTSNSYRYYIYKNITAPGPYQLRGTVSNVMQNQFTWDNSSFAGFYYDINKNLGVETLTFRPTDATPTGATLSDQADANNNRGVVYQTHAQPKSFAFKPWGYYYNMSFLGQSYFAGYIEGSGFEDGILWHKSKEPNFLANSQLGKVLVDSGEPHMVKSGTSLKLNEGFEARLYVDDSCNKTLLELYRNGNLTDRDYFTVPHTYVHTKDVGNSRNISILALHVSGVKCTGGKTCIVDGVFQISDTMTPINSEQQYDKMSIRNVDATGMTITMDNKDNQITLSKNIDVPLMQNIHIKTADQDGTDAAPLRYYIYSV
jgi:S-layer protein (TIGR01567 family)